MAKAQPRLPTSMPAFRQLVSATKTAAARDELAEACWRECRRAGGVRSTKPAKTGAPAAMRLYEARLLEIAQAMPRPWDSSAVRQLMHIRSKLMIAWLARCAAGNDSIDAGLAQHLAWTGADRFVPTLSRLLQGKNLRLMRGIAEGAGRAALHERASPRFRRRMFDALTPFVDGSRALGASDAARDVIAAAAESMIHLDAKRAVALMCGPSCIRTGNRAIRIVLLQLSSYREDVSARDAPQIDPNLLWPIYDLARQEKLPIDRKGFHDQVAGLVLTFTADVDPVRTRRECREAIKATGKGWSCLKDEANAALRRCKRVPEPGRAARWMERHPGKLSPEVEGVLRAHELAHHVLNDGFPLYFHNAGRHWKEARAGLQAMGLTRAATLLRDAAGVFGRQGPPSSDRGCAAAYKALDQNQVAKLEAIGSVFDGFATSVLAEVERYMSRNAASLPRV